MMSEVIGRKSLKNWLVGFVLACCGFLLAAPEALADHNCPVNNPSNPGWFNIVDHRYNSSWCTLCGDGQVTIEIDVPGGIRGSNQHIENIVITENLGTSELEYIPGSTNSSAGPAGDPIISGTTLTWTQVQVPALASRNENSTMTITFGVRSRADREEELVTNNRTLNAQASFDYCDFPRTTDYDSMELDIREPIPGMDKRGRNIDAGQSNYTNNVYGNINDDVIWRIQISNSGDADMQDVRFDDLMTNPNVDINYACPSNAAAVAVANSNGVDPGGNGCVSAGNNINNFELDNQFSSGPGRVDVRAGSSRNIYLVGKVNSSCSNGTNRASDLQWGCEIDGDTGVGGISDPATAGPPGADSEDMLTVSNGGLRIVQDITGTNLGQPLGAAGFVTITINNQTGGSVKDIQFVNDLPDEYVVDTTFDPQIISLNRGVDGHGANYSATYPGMVDTLQWRMGSLSWGQWDSDPLQNNRPEFRLRSSTVHPVYGDQRHMMRQGDEMVIRFRIVTTEPNFYDKAADLDLPEELAGADDPNSNISLADNVLSIDYEDFCPSTNPPTQIENEPVTPDPEDLDFLAQPPLYIVRDSGTTTMTVELVNNGGHEANDHTVYVTFGEAMTVVSSGSCSQVATPDYPNSSTIHPLWEQPAFLPNSSSVYLCDNLGVIQPGQTVTLNFDVERNHAAVDDDLTFRADVVGVITLSDGSELDFPSPANVSGTFPDLQQANNYSLDGIRAKALGFNLVKERANECTELTAESAFPNDLIIIGEDCGFEIHAGGWFGFDTPGYNLIEVRDITVKDDMPDGQGYIADNRLACSEVSLPSADSQCVEISGPVSELGGLNNPLSELDLEWDIVDPISVRNRWFLSDMTTRLLNDPVDTVAVPNQHANVSTDFGRAQFTAVFDSETVTVDNSGGVPANIPGYPAESEWREDLTITEPNIEVQKQVCNENLYGNGISCSNFVDFTNEGHRDQTYIFRLTLTNRAADSGVDRAPAYDLVITDTLDPSGQMCVQPLEADGIDNDGDGSSETASGLDGLVGISAGANDYSEATHCADGGTPAIVTFSYEQSAALERLNPGESIELYYRIKPHQSVAPLQIFTNSFSAGYDSLEGDFGNQNAPQIDSDADNDGVGDGTPEAGRARHYQSADATAQMQIIEVQAEPKQALELSNGTASGSTSDNVVVGEEIRYQLTAQIPAAKLRNFIIRDELPPGMRCIEGQVVNLDTSPYDAAGFVPGGSFNPTCTSTGSNDFIEWDFGDQELTTVTGSLFEFPVEFIARIENSGNTNDGDVIGNGGSYTTAQVSYVDEGGNTVVVPFESHEVTVLEPNITLTKSFAVANSDADDILTVTVTAENIGTADAYNLQVLDDLTGTKMVYLGNIAGTDPPQNDDVTTIGANAPIFSWNRANADYTIAPGETKSFTFDVKVEQGVEPHEILDNTIEARWQSLPGQDVALNSGGEIGIDGAADGMRIGVLPNAGDAINDYEANASAQTEVLPLVFTKTDLDPSVVPTIGAHKNFQIEIQLPEGVTQNVVITDQLGSPEGYVLTHNADYDITYEFIGIESINGNTSPDESAFNSFPADNTAGNATWDIGTVDTDSEDDTAVSALMPTIRINYFARVENDLPTNAGDSRQNGANVAYVNGEDASTESLNDNTASVTVVEPQLTIGKVVTNATNPGNLPVGGDVLEYVITVQHDGTSTADAFDLNLVDTLPTELRFDSSFTPTATVNSAAVAGFVTTPAGAPAGPLIWGKNNGDNSLDLPLGGTLVLTYRTEVTGVFGQPISNSVMLDWTSLNDSSINDIAYERDGEGCPTISAPDDYCVGPAEASIDTVDNTSIVKTVIADTDTDTAVGEMRVGDTVTYRLELNLQSGTTPSVTVQDQLPGGLTFESVVSVNGDTAAPYTDVLNGFSYSANSVPAPGATGTVTWDLGDITSEFGNSNAFVIEYAARVTEDTGISAPSATLTNTATLNYTGAASTLQDSATITVLQPVIDGLAKTDRGGKTSPFTVADLANDTMQFRLEACNSGLAPAYNLSLTDDLANEMDETSIVNLAVNVDGNPLTEGTDYTYSAPATRGDDMLFEFSAPVAPGACIQVDYDIGFYTDVPGNQTWYNTFSVNDFWSLPADEGQLYAQVDLGLGFEMNTGATVVAAPVKTLTSAASGVIGSDVTYTIEVSGADNAAIYDVAVTDTLDASLELVSVQQVGGPAFTDNTVSGSNNIDLAIDSLPAGQAAEFEITARVANNATAQKGHSFDNSADLSYAETDGGAQQSAGAGTAATFTVIEPELAIAKDGNNISNPGNMPVGGDILEYVITVDHLGTSTADTYELNLVDSLPPELEFQPGSASATIGGNPVAGFNPAPTISGQQLTWGKGNSDNSLDLPQGQQLVLTYRTQVTAVFGQPINNSVVADFTSLDETDPNAAYERHGDGCPTIVDPNDYCIGPVQKVFNTADNTDLQKTVLSDSYADTTDGTVRVGDTVTFQLQMNLQQGTTNNVVLADTLPAGMELDALLSINGDDTAPYSSGNGYSYSDITAVPAQGDTGTLTWSFGDVTNAGASGPLVIEYRVRVAEDTGIPHQPTTTLTNNAELNYSDSSGTPRPTLTGSADVTVLQPLMDNLTKDEATWPMPAGHMNVNPASDTMQFTLQACNAGLAPAYNLSLTDDLSSEMDETSIANVAVRVDGNLLTQGTDYTYTAPTARGGDMLFEFSSAIDPGLCLEVDYEIGFHTDIPGGTNWQNTFALNDYWSLPNEAGQQYAAVPLPAPYPMATPVTSVDPLQKTLQTDATAPVGSEVVYRIQVPGTAANAAIYDVAVTDVLDPSLELVSVEEVNGRAFTDGSTGNNLNLTLDIIPAGQVMVFDVTARVANNSTAQAGHAFDNVAGYTYAVTDGGVAADGGDGTAPTLTIVEPVLNLAKNLENVTSPGVAPDAGDTLRFTLDLSEAGNADSSDALDLLVREQLALGLVFEPGSASFAGNPLVDPNIAGDGSSTAQMLEWTRALADLDIVTGGNAQLVFDVRVLDTALASADLSGSSRIEWTSLDDDNSGAYERNGTESPALNDYVLKDQIAQLTAANDSAITKTRLDDSYGTGDAQLRVGDYVEYELRLNLQEGSLPNAALVDTLPQGMVFDGTLAINGDSSAPFAASGPFSHGDIAEPTQAGDPAVGPSTVTWDIADLVNTGDNAANDEFVVRYRARVLNQDVHPWPAANTPLTNNADFNYDINGGTDTRNAGQTLDLLQPELSVALTSTPATGSTLAPNDVVDYTVTITNSGAGPAYDTVFRDTIPGGLRQAGVSVQSTSVNGAAVANLAPVFDASTGEAVWNFGGGTAYAIEPGQSLVMTYRVQADSNLGSGLNLQNAAFAEVYYSLDDDDLPTLGTAAATVDMREDYGPTATESVQFNTPDAEPLAIENTQLTASIGEPFRYRVTVPATPQSTALHDVRVLMNLDASAADLVFVEAAKVSGSQAFTPINSGSGTDLIIEDTANGIDIPAGEQVVIDVTVRLRDVNPPNVDTLTFSNSASYGYNYENDNAAAGQGTGTGATTADMTVVEPTDLIMDKTGPASVQSGVPGRFTLDVHNIGTGPAWDISVTDILPNTDPGGMCETAPENFVAQLADGAGNVVGTLSQGSDFSVAFDAASCTLTVTTSGANAMVPADGRLLFSYDAYLDADTPDGASLTNVAGVELWHSWDSTGPDARQYTRPAPTDGTPSVVDHEDVFVITAAVPNVSFRKVVENITSGDSPATVATPGDRLRYTLTLTNLSSVDVDSIELTDELGRLNSAPLYQSGTLVVTNAAGGDSSNTNAAGGVHGSGLLDIRNLALAGNASLEIVYEVNLADVIDSGTAVLNQAQVQLPGQLLQDSDDPNINGADDPDTAGDEDPTQVLIESEPQLVVEKTSQDMTGDSDLLMVGDTLRYTLRVENTGNENIVDAILRDQVPANTTYVANSTRLNGGAVTDVSGSTALAAGMAINSPGEAGGFVAAAATGAQPVIITFDVTINDVRDGTLISNQGFLNGDGAGSGSFDEVPSDDPATDTPDDPTIDIVGDVPLLIAQKTVEISQDNVSAGIVDPGDELMYTITVTNMGGVDATDAVLTDQLPANTTYVAGTTTLNGLAVADNGGGTSRLDAGLPISSDDLTPPMPGAGEGVITSAETATVTFKVTVNAGTPTGTVISNQGSVSTVELPLTLTDADGNPSNGAQPTEVVVGDAQQLSITKEVAVVGGGAAEPGAVLEYLVKVTNISAVPATYVTITDDLLVAGDGVLTYVGGSAQLNGQPDGITVAGSVITADFAGTFGELQPDDTATLRFQAMLGDNLEIGYSVLNTAEVQWNDPASSNQASVAIDVGGTPGIANLNGYLWHDVNFNDQLDAEERLLQNWSVELYFNNALMDTIQSDEDGFFQFTGLVPNLAGGASYELRYTAPNASESTASLGNASSDFSNGPQQITEIFLGSGSNPQNLNLPLTPNGVVYDSVLRQPIAGATLTMLRASTGQALPDRCFDDEQQQDQLTQSGGYYKFDINFSDAACPANADYLIQVQVPGDDYVAGESLIIPPQTNVDTAGFDVGACLGSNADMVSGTPDHCEVQEFAQQPPLDVDARSEATDYYLRLTLDDNRIPGESQLFNNHIALDPQLDGALSITKTAALLNVTRSQLVPYTITFSNTLPVTMTDLRLVDFFPAGFKYVAGSARIDGQAIEPEVDGLQLVWPDLRAEPDQTRTVKLLLVVGSGVGEGKYVNRARMFNQLSGQTASGEASATVRVVPDPTFDCTDVIGKVYDDKNMNGYQDAGEGGVPGARVVTATGLNATTDAHGRFHITCAVVPNRDRGSNFVLKLDDRSLPSGYRLTTENPRVQRATRGKMIKFNFGTSLHRVVRLDMAEGVFEPETTQLRPQWHSRTELLLEKLQEAPSVLRLSYLAENEDPDLVEQRLQTIKAQIADEWARNYGDYELTIETEVFWRRGAPPSEGGLE